MQMTKWTLNRRLPIGIALLSGLIGVISCATSIARDSQLISSDSAQSIAGKYLGFESPGHLPLAATSVKLDTYTDTTTPVISKAFSGHQIWTLRYDSIYLWNSSIPRPQECRDPRNFEALVDASTGQLLRVYSVPKVVDSNLLPEENGEYIADQRKGTETWLGLPASPPPITFRQALDSAVGISRLTAKEIIGDCILMTPIGSTDTLLVWSIIGRGVPPVTISGSVEPSKYNNRERVVVDATTGRPLFVTNWP